jgi:hypothetical protein
MRPFCCVMGPFTHMGKELARKIPAWATPQDHLRGVEQGLKARPIIYGLGFQPFENGDKRASRFPGTLSQAGMESGLRPFFLLTID